MNLLLLKLPLLFCCLLCTVLLSRDFRVFTLVVELLILEQLELSDFSSSLSLLFSSEQVEQHDPEPEPEPDGRDRYFPVFSEF